MTQFPVTLTDEAIEQAKRVLAKQAKGSYLRVGVKGGGCSGLEYVIRAEEAPKPTDLQLEVGGLQLICDPKSATFLMGSTLKYTGNLIGGGFLFENPNAGRSCGCGTSFMPKNASEAKR